MAKTRRIETYHVVSLELDQLGGTQRLLVRKRRVSGVRIADARRVLDKFKKMAPCSRSCLHGLDDSPSSQVGGRRHGVGPILEGTPVQVVLVPSGSTHELDGDLRWLEHSTDERRTLGEHLLHRISGWTPRKRRNEKTKSHAYKHGRKSDASASNSTNRARPHPSCPGIHRREMGSRPGTKFRTPPTPFGQLRGQTSRR